MTPLPATVVASGRVIAEPRIAPDGRSVVFWTRTVAGPALVRVNVAADLDSGGVSGAVGAEVLLALQPAPIGIHPSGGGSFCWLPNSSGLLYASRDGLFRSGLNAGASFMLAGPSTNDGSLSQPVASPDLPWIVAVESRGNHDALVVIPSGGGVAVEVHRAPFVIDPSWGPNGTLVWHEWSPPAMAWDDSTIVCAHIAAVDGGPVATIRWRTPTGGVGRGQARVSPNGERIAYVDDSSGFMNVVVRSTFDVDAAPWAVVVEQHEHATPTWGAGQRSHCWSPDSRQIAFVRNEEGFARLCVVDVVGEGPTSTGPIELAKAWHLGLSWARTSEGVERLAAVRSGGKTPPQLVVYWFPSGDPSNAQRRMIVHSASGIWDGETPQEPIVVQWTSGDGATLHGRLFRPSDFAGSTPLIVSLHGGPTDQSTVEFNGRTQFWISRGWSVFDVDYRGSSGWGRAHQQALNGGWGELDVSDAASAVRHAVERGWADADRVVAMGASAGGFTVLNLLASYPQLCAAGVAVYPVTDLLDLDDRTHRFEKQYSAVLVGPRPASEHLYVERSPITHVDRIVTPLLLLHGDADEVVPVEQSVRLQTRLADLGRDSELHVYEGEGHGWKLPETKVDELERTVAFLVARGLMTDGMR